jgi:hypothetical protein
VSQLALLVEIIIENSKRKTGAIAGVRLARTMYHPVNFRKKEKGVNWENNIIFPIRI